VIEAARLLIVHMAAQHAGMTVLSGTIARDDVVVAPPAQPAGNGVDPAKAGKTRKKPGPKPRAARAARVQLSGYELDDFEEEDDA
jgi:hypothetical protein